MGNYEQDFIEKMREEIQIPDLVNDKLNESYEKIQRRLQLRAPSLHYPEYFI